MLRRLLLLVLLTAALAAIAAVPAAASDPAAQRAKAAVAATSGPQRFVARAADFAPNDTGVARKAGPAGGWQMQQWDLTGPFGINLREGWELARQAGGEGGHDVEVAVLDTGVAYADRDRYRRSPELPAERLLKGYDFVEDDRFPNDANGHGTFVATTIAGAANNGFGMVGVAYRASIMPVRVLNADGEGSSTRIAEGIRYAADRGADVINVSIELYDELGLQALPMTSAPEIRSALQYANRRKVVIVAAAGNAAQSDVPARTLGGTTIYVGGTTEHGCVGDYSNTGPGLDLVAPGGGADAPYREDPNCRVDAAPGRNVLQVTFPRRSPGRFVVPTNYKGTSMAAPHVTGVVALMLASHVLGEHPTPAAVGLRLYATTRDLGRPGRDPRYGFGLLDAAAALRGTPTPPPPPA